jgi:hypothetical protein
MRLESIIINIYQKVMAIVGEVVGYKPANVVRNKRVL